MWAFAITEGPYSLRCSWYLLFFKKKKEKEKEATVLFSKTKMTLERFHGKALQTKKLLSSSNEGRKGHGEKKDVPIEKLAHDER